MIYIGTDSEGGCGIYLDVHAVERQNHGIQVSAVIGDGCYEGDVLIELAERLQVTFVDALWGDTQALRDFFARHGEERICADLRDAAQVWRLRERGAEAERGTRPHVYLPLFDTHGLIAESRPA